MIRTERNAPPDDDLIYDDVSVAAANGGGGGALGGHSYITLNGFFLPKMLKFQPYSILTGDTMVGFVIFCVLNLSDVHVLISCALYVCLGHFCISTLLSKRE